MKIAVIGSNMIDLVTTVIRMPRVGETIEAPSFDMGFGGKGANQAVAVAKLGGDVLMMTKVGDDIFGPSVKKNFESMGIDTKYVDMVPGVSSGVAPIFVDASSNNSILIVKGANNFLHPEDIDRAAEDIKGCGLIILQLEVPLETVYYAIEWGAKNGVQVILNPAPAAELDYSYVRKASFLVPNETELETITKMPVSTMSEIAAAARALVREGVRSVIVTLGSKGSLYVAEGREELVPPHTVKSVDSTGAGDAFIGSFAQYYLKTGDVIETMKTANRYAALSTMKPGTQKSFPTLEEFERYAG
ncbi:MAG: ribokinase [Synergistaceae bacterium]|jgi:ribokinase|nr:ribokinase [Synergistaceae bacterium]